MPNLEVEVMLEDHPHLFVVDVDSVLEAQFLKGIKMKCGMCNHIGKVVRVGTPGRKERSPQEHDPNQKSMFKE
jgi:hypothetical protein